AIMDVATGEVEPYNVAVGQLLDWSPDGALLLSRNADTITLTDLSTRQETNLSVELEPLGWVPDADTGNVIFSPDGAFIAAAVTPREIALIDTVSFAQFIVEVTGEDDIEVELVDWPTETDIIAIDNADPTGERFYGSIDVASGEITSLPYPPLTRYGMSISEDTTLAFIGLADDDQEFATDIEQLDTTTGEYTILLDDFGSIADFEASGDADYLGYTLVCEAYANRSEIQILDVIAYEIITLLPCDSDLILTGVDTFELSPDGTQIAYIVADPETFERGVVVAATDGSAQDLFFPSIETDD
ncbi:MAG: WD40 repeat domain-containing protein, partial [Pseudomonadota bacterium]